MSRSGILEALRNEERSLRSQLVAIQRAIEAIEGNAPPTAGRGRTEAAKAVRRRKRPMSDRSDATRRPRWRLAGLDRSATPRRIRADERTSRPISDPTLRSEFRASE